MAHCLNEQETDIQEPIYPEIKQGIFCGVCLYDQVVKPRRGSNDKYRQMYDNLPAIHKDKQVFRKLVSCHGFKQDEIFLLTDPKVNECNSITVKLNRLFKKNPDQIILAFSCYAGHGMI